MQRDMDLARQILLVLEEKEHSGIDCVAIDGYEGNYISYHVALLHDAGLIANVDDHRIFGGVHHCWPDRLTMEGHEFLEASRDNNRWEKAKEMTLKKGGGVTFDVLKQLLVRLMTEAVMS